MPEQQKNISPDAARSILQHSMFGVLFVLLLLNWRVHRPMDYTPFEESLNVSNKKIILYNNSYLLYFKEAVEDYGMEKEIRMNALAIHVNESAEILIHSIDSFQSNIDEGKLSSPFVYKQNLDLLLHLVNQYNNNALGFLSEDSNGAINKYLPTNAKSIHEFRNILDKESYQFVYKSDGAVEGTLMALKNAIYFTELMILERLFDKVRESGCIFYGYKAIAIPESGFNIPGQTLKSFLTVAEYGLPIRVGPPTLITESGKVVKYEQGIFYWSERNTNLGLHTVKGSIKYDRKSIKIDEPFTFSYFVSATGIAFHLDKANVCYVGAANPISISVPGYAADKIKLRVAGAKVSKTGDSTFEVYFAKMPAGKVYAYVDATNTQGRTSTVHSMELKLQNLLAPVTNFEQYKDEGIDVVSFFGQERLRVLAADDAFAMEYEVLSFQVEGFTHDGKHIEPMTVYGDELSSNHKLNSVFNSIVSGDRFILSNIKARGANGMVYEAKPITLKLKE